MTEQGENFDRGYDPADSQLEELLTSRGDRFANSPRHDMLRERLLEKIANTEPAGRVAPKTSTFVSAAVGLMRVAAIVVVAMGLSWLVGSIVRSGGGPAGAPGTELFAAVADFIRSVATVSYNQTVTLADGSSLDCDVDFDSDGLELRHYKDGSVQYSDYGQGRVLYLPAGGDWSVELTIAAEQFYGHVAQPWLLLRDLADSAAGIEPERQDDGTVMFSVRRSTGELIDIYCDPVSKRPVRVEIESETVSISMDDFAWSSPDDIGAGKDNSSMAESLTEHVSRKYHIDLSFINQEPTSGDLAEMIGILCKLNGGKSPDDLRSETIKKLVKPLQLATANITDMGTSMAMFTGKNEVNSDGTPAMVASLESLRKLIHVQRGLKFLSLLCDREADIKYFPGVSVDSAGAVVIYSDSGTGLEIRINSDGATDTHSK